MHASIGDRLRIHSNQVGTSDHCGQIIEIRGADGAPPYMVQFDDGHERLIFPGGDAVIEAAPAEAPDAGTPNVETSGADAGADSA